MPLPLTRPLRGHPIPERDGDEIPRLGTQSWWPWRLESASRNRGLTLLELLVVISIILILSVAALPSMMPSKEGRRLREAARAINTFLGTARARAIELGRPVGVWFEHIHGDQSANVKYSYVASSFNTNQWYGCNTLYLAESPPPYSGNTYDARVRVKYLGNYLYQATWPNDGTFTMEMVHRFDLIQFNNQGQLFLLSPYGNSEGGEYDRNREDVATSHTLTFQITNLLLTGTDQAYYKNTGGLSTPWITAYYSTPLTYKIWRRPVRSNAVALTLPAGVAIDLEYSGSEADPQWFARTSESEAANDRMMPVILMFSPHGSADQVYSWVSVGSVYAWMPRLAIEPIYLLLGQQTRLHQGTDNENEEELKGNHQLRSNLWITLQPRTGLVKAAEMFSVTPKRAKNVTAVELATARALARGLEGMGGQ